MTPMIFIVFQADDLTRDDFKGSKVRHLPLEQEPDSNSIFLFLFVFSLRYCSYSSYYNSSFTHRMVD